MAVEIEMELRAPVGAGVKRDNVRELSWLLHRPVAVGMRHRYLPRYLYTLIAVAAYHIGVTLGGVPFSVEAPFMVPLADRPDMLASWHIPSPSNVCFPERSRRAG